MWHGLKVQAATLRAFQKTSDGHSDGPFRSDARGQDCLGSRVNMAPYVPGMNLSAVSSYSLDPRFNHGVEPVGAVC